ncbi:MAG: amidohydrolase family protein, partial [Caulobacterales bacterium]|nr:amidohydrolase family protein [Caulobacterales bacterium]
MTVLRACCVAGFASVMLASACATVNSAEGRGGADTVLVNGAVYTGDAASPWAEAVAISDGRVLAVGSASQLAAHAGAAATVIDLEGRMAMPGLIDSHLHPMDGALKALFSCNFPFSATLDDIADTVSACVAGAPDSEWIVGGQWDSDFFVNNTLASPRSWLDRRSGDYAVVLIDDSGHNVWVNSLALEKMGVDAATPDPDGGRIRREADGTTPNGVLEETAAKALRTRLPVASLEDHVRAGREVQRIMLGHGVIGMKSARATDRAVEAFAALDAAGELKMRFTASLETPYGARAEPLDVAGLAAKRDGFASEHVRTSAVKIFLDGVPTASRTARMLAPYVPNTEHGARYLGEMHLEPDRLTEDVIALDAAGFAIKIHTAGDGSVRVALDA